jgi:hypothetical protein
MASSIIEFNSYIYKENKIATRNANVLRMRPTSIAIALLMLAWIFIQLELPRLSAFIVGAGFIMLIISKIVDACERPSVGYRPFKLKLTANAIFIGREKVEVSHPSDLTVRIVGYKGQTADLRGRTTHNGNENILKIRRGDSVVEMRFVLHSEPHKDQLVAFCKANGFSVW